MSTCVKTFNLFVEGCDTEDPPIATKFFAPGANDFLQAVIPVDKPGVYQLRYMGGSQSYTCTLAPPSDNFFAAFLGDVRILRNGFAETAAWIQSDWIGNLFAHAGAIFENSFSLNGDHMVIFEEEGFPGIYSLGSSSSSEAWVEAHLTNLALIPKHQKFCFERSLNGGETIRFEFNQDMFPPGLPLCFGSGVHVFGPNTTEIALLRVSHC